MDVDVLDFEVGPGGGDFMGDAEGSGDGDAVPVVKSLLKELPLTDVAGHEHVVPLVALQLHWRGHRGKGIGIAVPHPQLL